MITRGFINTYISRAAAKDMEASGVLWEFVEFAWVDTIKTWGALQCEGPLSFEWRPSVYPLSSAVPDWYDDPEYDSLFIFGPIISPEE